MNDKATSDEKKKSRPWSPHCDIYETKNNVVLNLALPGVKIEHIKIKYDKGMLSVQGENPFDSDSDSTERQYYRIENHYGAFERYFEIPRTLDTQNVQAEYWDGVLNLTFPKQTESSSNEIIIKHKYPVEPEQLNKSTAPESITEFAQRKDQHPSTEREEQKDKTEEKVENTERSIAVKVHYQNELQKQYMLLAEKIGALRKAYVLESEASSRFKLKKQIEENEADLQEIEEKLSSLPK